MNSQPLRIVHCLRSPIGGTIRHIHDLAKAQAAAGHEVGLVCDSSTGSAFDLAILDRLRPHLALGVTRFAMRRHLTIQDIAAAARLYGSVRALAPDVLHGHGAKGGAYVRLIGSLLRGRKHRPVRVYSPHGGSLHYDPNRCEGRIYHAIERLQNRFTDGLLFVADYEKAAYESKIGALRVPSRVVYNGLLREDFEPVAQQANAADFVYVGMLRQLKGTDLFIDAIYDLTLQTGRRISAIIAGEGPQRAEFEARAAQLGLADCITFAGAMPARRAFAMGRCVVVPSRAEAMPYVVLEAIGAGMPIVATRVGGIPEIFGVHADRLVDSGSSSRLASAMRAVMASPERARAQTAEVRQSIMGTFTAPRMGELVISFYHQLLGIPTVTSTEATSSLTQGASLLARSSKQGS
ncbi:glycosyltransferase family 4 protein [Pannonibacter phragmitetus]|uniref:Glycosyl transferase n=1 Tax=Pannonibacter phragmitetus TaxID=121719 RepID=A0A0U3ETA5_9HYPH|nr:glycosyltransferase family 4 protein [Pannonibacter phragmitetus]ALV29375.1 glycosyl transferase [Pannonibacter phragmitetus]